MRLSRRATRSSPHYVVDPQLAKLLNAVFGIPGAASSAQRSGRDLRDWNSGESGDWSKLHDLPVGRAAA